VPSRRMSAGQERSSSPVDDHPGCPLSRPILASTPAYREVAGSGTRSPSPKPCAWTWRPRSRTRQDSGKNGDGESRGRKTGTSRWVGTSTDGEGCASTRPVSVRRLAPIPPTAVRSGRPGSSGPGRSWLRTRAEALRQPARPRLVVPPARPGRSSPPAGRRSRGRCRSGSVRRRSAGYGWRLGIGEAGVVIELVGREWRAGDSLGQLAIYPLFPRCVPLIRPEPGSGT
jgi:hypothetical protein